MITGGRYAVHAYCLIHVHCISIVSLPNKQRQVVTFLQSARPSIIFGLFVQKPVSVTMI